MTRNCASEQKEILGNYTTGTLEDLRSTELLIGRDNEYGLLQPFSYAAHRFAAVFKDALKVDWVRFKP